MKGDKMEKSTYTPDNSYSKKKQISYNSRSKYHTEHTCACCYRFIKRNKLLRFKYAHKSHNKSNVHRSNRCGNEQAIGYEHQQSQLSMESNMPNTMNEYQHYNNNHQRERERKTTHSPRHRNNIYLNSSCECAGAYILDNS